MFELEGKLSCRHSQFKFLNRSVTIFSVEDYNIHPKGKGQVKIKILFHEELSEIAIAKVFDGNAILTFKIKLSRNYFVVEVTNNYNTVSFIDHRKALGIVDSRSLGYCNISHRTLSNNLSSIYEFECLGKLCNQYNEVVNKINLANKDTFYKITETKELNNSNKNRYPCSAWWTSRTLSDKEILDKSINLKDSELTESEKKDLMTIIYEHEAAFSLHDEIEQCPNIKIDIEVIDESPFLVRPFPISEKIIMDWQMERLVSLGILSKRALVILHQ